MNGTESGARSKGVAPFRFADVVVDPAARTLARAGVLQPLEPKAYAVLLVLLQHAGELIARDDLLDQVWGHRHVTPGVLTRAIAQLRHALSEDSQQPRYIQTRHALGYCFIGSLLEPDAADVEAVPPEEASPVEGSLPAAESLSLDAALPMAATSPVSEPEPEPAHDEPVAAEPVDAPVPEPATPVWSTAEPEARRHSRRRLALVAVLLLAAMAGWGMFERPAAPSKRLAASVAVLPFTNLSGNPHDDYFAEGLAEEMRDALAGVPGLKVAVTAPPAAKDGAVDAKALGERLGVAAVLGASVRREGQHLRITAHLTDTTTGFTLWSHTYDRELAGVFDTQRDIAGEVVHALLGAIPSDSEALARRLAPTRNAAAFDIYLQGLRWLRKAEQPQAIDQAIAHFDQALQHDSGFARAQAGICRAQVWRFRIRHNAEALDQAKAACQRAEQMDPAMAETDLALGDLYAAAGDPTRALQHYGVAARSPRLATQAHVGLAKVHAAQGHKEQAEAEFRAALALEPGSAGILAELGYQQYLDGKIAQAVVSYRRAVALRPESAELWGTLGALYMQAGNDAAAEQALEHAIGMAPAMDTLTNLGLLKYQHGDYAAAVALQRQATALDPEDFMVWGNLGTTLRADPASSAADARQAFAEAASRAERYLKLKGDDARAVASLGLYRVMLGDTAVARQLVARAEALGSQPGEVALLNAETLALLGDLAPARERLAAARAAGIAETLITGNDTFRRLGLLSPPSAAGRPAATESTTLHASAGPSTGG